MVNKGDLGPGVVKCLQESGGRTSIVQLCRWVWKNYEQELRRLGDLFYTWQYDIRWAVHELRREGRLRPAEVSSRGIYELN